MTRRAVACRIGVFAAIGVALVLAVVAVGAAVGRWRVLPVEGRGTGVHVASSDAIVVVPVPRDTLRDGDVVFARTEHGDGNALYHIDGVDSFTHDIYVKDEHGRATRVLVGKYARRVSQVVPYAGWPYRVLVGWFQGAMLVLLSMALLVRAMVQRHLRSLASTGGIVSAVVGFALGTRGLRDNINVEGLGRDELIERLRREVKRASRPLRGSWIVLRFAAMVAWSLGVLSLSAYATFQGSTNAAVNQGTITAGHMLLTAASAGAANRLTLGATGLEPGDTMQRAVDLSVDASTNAANNAGIMTGIQLYVNATTSSLLDTNSSGLMVYIQQCTVAYVEATQNPYTYDSCAAHGGSASDVLGSTGSYTSVSTFNSSSSPATLTGVSTSAGSTTHLLISIKISSSAGDSFQDASSILQWNFIGQQRSGAAR